MYMQGITPGCANCHTRTRAPRLLLANCLWLWGTAEATVGSEAGRLKAKTKGRSTTCVDRLQRG